MTTAYRLTRSARSGRRELGFRQLVDQFVGMFPAHSQKLIFY
jgi:hypothetical protein